jgi:hypothetical protein
MRSVLSDDNVSEYSTASKASTNTVIVTIVEETVTVPTRKPAQ